MVFNNSILLGAAGQATGQAPFDPTLIGNSAWYDGSSDYMNSPSFSAQADPTCFIFATWIQLLDFSIGSLGQYLWSAERPSNYASIRISNTNTLVAYSNPGQFESSMIFRDIGWYHIICSYKGPDNTVRMFVNGNEITATKNANNLASNLEPVHASHTHRIGAYFSGATGGTLATTKSYMAQTVFLDGFSFQDGDVTISDFLDTHTFGTNGSQFIPKTNSDLATLAGTAGANSYVIDYADSSNLGNDISSKNNNFTLVSMGSANQSTHTPSRTYLQLNPLQKFGTADLSEGNTRVGVDVSDSIRGTKYATTGKKYLEVTLNTVNNSYIGVANGSNNPSSFASSNVACLQKDGDIYINDSVLGSGRSKTFTTGDVVGILIDADAKKFWQSVNGTFNSLDRDSSITLSASDILAGTGGFDLSGLTGDDGNYVLHIGNSDGTSADVSINGGHKSFSHTPPTGYTGWASDDYTAPDFQGIDYFDATLYEGNGQNQRVGDFVPFTDTYTVDKSAMFDDGDRRYLARTYTSSDTARSSNSQATISYWIKFCSNGANQWIFSASNSGQTERFLNYINDQSGQQSIYMTLDGAGANRDFEIPISKLSEQEWTNIVYNIDVDNSTAADKIKCWVNGVQQTSTDTSYQSASNADYFLFDNEEHFIGNLAPASAGYTVFSLNSYLAEMHVLDGQLKAPTDFGQVDTSTNRWVPKDYKTNVGTYGNRGFYMAFDNATGTGNGVGTDSSGNGFNFTESFVSGGSAWATSDTVTDTPSQNFDNLGGASSGSPTISDGHTLATIAAGGKQIRSNFNLNAGKWYVEVDIQATNNSASVGLVPSRSATFANGPGRDANGGISYETDGDVFSDNVQDATAEASFAAGDVVQMAIDMDAKKVYFGKNNTFGGNPAAGTGGHFLPASILSDGAALITLGGYSGSQAATMQINYGQFLVFDGGSTTNGFKYTPPTGFKAVNQDNLDDTASKITAWAWIKNRDATDNHMLFDRVRGIGKDLHSNSTAAEATNANTVQRFLQRGVQVGNDAEVNTASESYVLWQWLLGDSATTGSTNSDGSVDTTVIAADTGHFSVVKGTTGSSGATFGHGLGAAPDLIINKDLNNSSSNWLVYNSIDGASFYLALNLTSTVSGPGSTVFGTEPTSTVFTLGSFFANVECINYCFRSVPGVCKVGQYAVNNTTDNGPYVSLGFKPRWIMFKSVSGIVSQWTIYDSVREPFNVGDHIFTYANLTSAEQAFAANDIDMLSDGFKIRADTNNEPNNGSGKYLYIAMADIGGNGTLPPIYGR